MKFSPPQRPLASWPHSRSASLDKTPDNCGDLWEGHGKLLGTRGTKYEKRATLGAERLKTRHCGDVSPSNLADIAKNRSGTESTALRQIGELQACRGRAAIGGQLIPFSGALNVGFDHDRAEALDDVRI